MKVVKTGPDFQKSANCLRTVVPLLLIFQKFLLPSLIMKNINEQHHEKNNNLGFRPGQT